MEFRETLLAAQRNQQQKSSESCYYKARFDPPKKEQKIRDKLSANVQKFLAKKEEEEKQKKLELLRKREELLALRDPKAMRKIQKTLKVIKSANKSVLQDAVDHEHTAVTREGPDQPDQDDYGYESQEAAALYEKMMQKYSKIPDTPKYPTGGQSVKKDLNGTRERVKQALQHEDEPVPHKRRRRGEREGEQSPPTKYEPEKKEAKPEKPKFRKPAPPPMDFNQLLKLAEQKKSVPVEVAPKKEVVETTTGERLMTKKQKQEYEQEMARRQRRQERLDAEKLGKPRVQKEGKPPEVERKNEPAGFGRIPKLSDKNNVTVNNNQRPPERERIDKSLNRNTQNTSRNSPKPSDRDRPDKEKLDRQREKAIDKDRARIDRDKERLEREKERIDRERLERLKAERERIDRDIERLNKDRDRLDKTKSKLESVRPEKGRPVDRSVDRSKVTKDSVNKNIDLKTQNTYRIDKNANDKKLTVPSRNSDGRYNMNGQSSSKPVPKLNKEQGLKNGLKERVLTSKDQRDGSPRVDNGKKVPSMNKGPPPKRPEERRPMPSKPQAAGAGSSKAVASFDFDKHVNSLKKNGLDKNGRPGDKRRPQDDNKKKKRRAVESDSEYDSEMDDFIDDGDENMDYSTHIKEIFGYDKSKYRDMDDDDDPSMESSFARQQREEYISKKIGIMEDLEDMRLEAMQKKQSKRRRISDD